LDPNKTSPFKLYQFLINTTDEDVERYLKILTLLTMEEIEQIVKKHFEKPENRYGQKVLAFKVTQIIHGTKQAQLAEKLSEFLFGTESKLDILASLDQEQLKTFQKEVGGKKYEQEDILDLLVNTNLAPSR
jgi:tyrosyl-tRNA synthetase